MNNFLDKTFTLSFRQVLQWMRYGLYVIVPVYLVLFFLNEWEKKMDGFGLRASPYYLQVPIECRASVMRATEVASSGLWNKVPFLQPDTAVLSLSLTEDKLGYGMKGLPCMGWEFLTSLHVTDTTRVQKFVNAKGDVVAIITLEVKKPFREELKREDWNAKHLPGWSALGPEEVQRDMRFVFGFTK
jgi:hypothetical protein